MTMEQRKCDVYATQTCLTSDGLLLSRIGVIIFRITYGYNAESKDEPLLRSALATVENFSEVTKPGAFLVDIITICM